MILKAGGCKGVAYLAMQQICKEGLLKLLLIPMQDALLFPGRLVFHAAVCQEILQALHHTTVAIEIFHTSIWS